MRGRPSLPSSHLTGPAARNQPDLRGPERPAAMFGSPAGEPEVDPDLGQESVRRYRLPEGRQRFGRRWAATRLIPVAEGEDQADVSPEPPAEDEIRKPDPAGAADQPPALDSSSNPPSRVKRAGGEAA